MSKTFVRLDTIARASKWNLGDRLAVIDKSGKQFIVVIHWNRAFTIRHEVKFDAVDSALKLVKRVNDGGTITPSCWLMPARAA